MVFKTDYHLMQVKRIALLTFIKLPFAIKIFVLSIFEWPFYTGFTVYTYSPVNIQIFELNMTCVSLSEVINIILWATKSQMKKNKHYFTGDETLVKLFPKIWILFLLYKTQQFKSVTVSCTYDITHVHIQCHIYDDLA